MQSEQQNHPIGGAQHDPGRGGYGGRGGYEGHGGYRGRGGGQGAFGHGRGPIVCYNYGQQGHYTQDYTNLMTICNYCKAFNHTIEECSVLLEKIQDK